MKLEALEKELEAYLESMTPDAPADVLQRNIARFEKMILETEKAVRERLEQRGKETGLENFIKSLESRVRSIKEECESLEATDLEHEAHELHVVAEDIESRLAELKQKLFAQRQSNLPNLRVEADSLAAKVTGLETDFQVLMRALEAEEKEARIEDEYPPEIRRLLLLKRVAHFYAEEGLGEHESLNKRAQHLERANGILGTLPEDAAGNWSKTWTPDLALSFAKDVRDTKLTMRLRLQDTQHLISEGLIDRDAQGDELPLPYSIRGRWQKGDKQGFYMRLWTLNLLLLSDPHPDPEMVKHVRSLLTLLDQASPKENAEDRMHANEARRFLMMAGRGVIRQFFEEQFDGLTSEENYVRMGRALCDRRQPYRMLQIAVNIPRLFDLSLAQHHEKIFEKRLRRKPVRQVTSHPEMGTTFDPDDLAGVSGDEFYEGWQVRLLTDGLTTTRHEEQEMDEVEVGKEPHMEAQEYVMDASGSMYPPYGSGKRWLLRNAIFIAALNSYSVDATLKGTKDFSNLLFFRIFGTQIGDVAAVRNQQEALRALKEFLVYNKNWQGTDLQGAMETAYGDIRRAKGKLRALRDAKVVMVTDGEGGLDLGALQRAQDIGGTKVVTHVFAVEEENPALKELSRSSGPGKAFYHKIDNAADQNLAALPPYGTPEEFSPIYRDPQFTTGAERQAFEVQVTDLCSKILERSRHNRKQDESQEKTRGDELKAFLFPQATGDTTSYEDSPKPEIADRRRRKSQRVQELVGILQVTADEHTTPGEAMRMMRSVGKERAVLARDLREISQKTGNSATKAAIRSYKEDIYPKIVDKAA